MSKAEKKIHALNHFKKYLNFLKLFSMLNTNCKEYSKF